MASVEENYEFWNDSYDWSRYGGDEWSARWGGPDVQWYWSLLPRVQDFLPSRSVLEIGPGFGRWTRFLRPHCEELILVDISERCLDACREEFAEQGVQYHLSDGQSLEFLEPESVDFVFSFESLIHTELDALRGYLTSLKRVLHPQGSAFIHHSNLGNYGGYFRFTDRLPKPLRRSLKRRGLLDYDEWRARSVTAENFAQASRDCGLGVLRQELVPWGGRRLIDCFTTLTAEPRDGDTKTLKNPDLMDRAYRIQRLSGLYGEGVPW